MAACGATIKGRRKILRHHNFRSRSAFSFQFTMQRLVRIAIDANIPVKSVFLDHDFAKVSFDDGFRNILAFFRAGILREGILQDLGQSSFINSAAIPMFLEYLHPSAGRDHLRGMLLHIPGVA